MGKEFLEKLQDDHCDSTRGTPKRFRVFRNVGEAAQYFPETEPVLCFGSGDGFEVQAWQLLEFDATGCDISRTKTKTAAKNDVSTIGGLEDLCPHNIYCAHTIEHLDDMEYYLDRFVRIAISTICLIFPVEPCGSQNPSHLSPVLSIHDIALPGFDVLLKKERWNDDREAIVIWRRRHVRYSH